MDFASPEGWGRTRETALMKRRLRMEALRKGRKPDAVLGDLGRHESVEYHVVNTFSATVVP